MPHKVRKFLNFQALIDVCSLNEYPISCTDFQQVSNPVRDLWSGLQLET